MLIVMDDENVVDANGKSVQRFEEATFFNGYAHVGKFSFAVKENSRMTLLCTNDRYYLVQVTLDREVLCANKIDPADAAKWLLNNNHYNLPAGLLNLSGKRFASFPM
jgi:hypothetical protein